MDVGQWINTKHSTYLALHSPVHFTQFFLMLGSTSLDTCASKTSPSAGRDAGSKCNITLSMCWQALSKCSGTRSMCIGAKLSKLDFETKQNWLSWLANMPQWTKTKQLCSVEKTESSHIRKILDDAANHYDTHPSYYIGHIWYMDTKDLNWTWLILA